MIFADGFCDVCRRYHAPDWDHKHDCPEQPLVFWSREAAQLYHERKALELKHAVEARERQKTAEARELAWAKASVGLGAYLEEQRQATFAAMSEELARLRAAYHEHLEAQEAARRLLRNRRVRERARDGG